MRVFILNSPLAKTEPQGYKAVTAPLNIAESQIRPLLSYSSKIEITDLSQTFDLGHQAIFAKGQLIGWKSLAVF